MSDFNESTCGECGLGCDILSDKSIGNISECCGVGFSYLDGIGDVVEVNSNLRYIEGWDE